MTVPSGVRQDQKPRPITFQTAYWHRSISEWCCNSRARRRETYTAAPRVEGEGEKDSKKQSASMPLPIHHRGPLNYLITNTVIIGIIRFKHWDFFFLGCSLSSDTFWKWPPYIDFHWSIAVYGRQSVGRAIRNGQLTRAKPSSFIYSKKKQMNNL